MGNNNLSELRNILIKAQTHGLDVSDLLRKVDNAITQSKSNSIKVVLMGAFSDGKTTVIGGLTEHLESNMKIAIEESSDELAFYHLPALGYDFEIVDTPGLFGTKEKEISGRQVRYSDITREYISQAHILIYVTDAVNPLKDSHKDILKFVLRDLGKLSSSIFVINKMDNAGYELSDDEDFNRGEKIKSAAFIQKLNETIALSPSERKALNIVCVSADPCGRGLSKHFSLMESYLKKSRINKLREIVIKVAKSSDKGSLKASVNQSSMTDLANQCLHLFQNHLRKSNAQIQDLSDTLGNLRLKSSRVREVTLKNKSLLQSELKTTQNEILTAIDSSSMADFNNTVQIYFGEKGERITQTIDNIFSKYAEMNNAAFNKANIQGTFDKMGDLTKGIIKSMGQVLKHTKISADVVKGARDILASGYKFKPWEAVKFGKTLTKVIGFIGIALDVIMWIKNYNEQKKFEKVKQELKDGCSQAFTQAHSYLSPETKYFENFAPGILFIDQAISNTEDNVKEFKRVNDIIKGFIYNLEKWNSSENNNDFKY